MCLVKGNAGFPRWGWLRADQHARVRAVTECGNTSCGVSGTPPRFVKSEHSRALPEATVGLGKWMTGRRLYDGQVGRPVPNVEDGPTVWNRSASTDSYALNATVHAVATDIAHRVPSVKVVLVRLSFPSNDFPFVIDTIILPAFVRALRDTPHGTHLGLDSGRVTTALRRVVTRPLSHGSRCARRSPVTQAASGCLRRPSA